MFRREFSVMAAAAVVIFAAVAVKSWMEVKRLRNDAQMLALDTLPGLVVAGKVGEHLHENQRRLHELIKPLSANERTQIILSVETNTSVALWQDYEKSIYSDQDRKNYLATMAARQKYLQLRGKYIQLIAENKIAEAGAQYDQELRPQFEDYMANVHRLFDYNADIGAEREKTILARARNAPFAIAGLTGMTFLIGGILGFRTALSGGIRLPVRKL